jgi:hypothetical protein
MLKSSSRIQFEHSVGSARDQVSFLADLPFFVAVLVAFALLIGAYHYRGEFSEGDTYGVLVGLLNGQATGRWLDDPAHYGIRFGYGYVALIYWLADLHLIALTRDSLIEAINNIGFGAAVASAALLMASLRIMYGSAVALIATAAFIFSPLFLEMATSGHQLLIALTFFLAANLILVADVPRSWNIAAYAMATLLLFAGLTMRAELPLAFSWLVFAQRPRGDATPRLLFRAVVSRSIVCVAAFAIFEIVFRCLLHAPPTDESAMSGVSAFLGTFYKLGNIPRGFVILIVGSGLLTTAIGSAVLIIGTVWALRTSDRLRVLPGTLNLLAPVSLIVIGVVFWMPNPSPARHFTFVLLGFAVLTAVGIVQRFPFGNLGAIAAGAAIVLANQALAEAVRPVILRNLHSQYLNFPERDRTTGAAPVGSFVRHHPGMVERQEVLTKLGRMISASCESRLVVVTSALFQFESLMFEPGADTRITGLMRIGKFTGIKVTRGNQVFVFVDPFLIWPGNPMDLILNDTQLNGYKIFQDPYSLSAADKTPIPADRSANLLRLTPEKQCFGGKLTAIG